MSWRHLGNRSLNTTILISFTMLVKLEIVGRWVKIYPTSERVSQTILSYQIRVPEGLTETTSQRLA